MFVGIGLVCVPAAMIAYARINARRDREAAAQGEKGVVGWTPQELREMGDRAPDFRYTL